MKNLAVTFFLLISLPALSQTNIWLPAEDLGGDARFYSVAFSIGDKIYVGTGADGSLNAMNDFWEYDPLLDEWNQKADLPAPARFGAVGFSIDGNGYIALGAGDQSTTLYNDVWQYDPGDDEWTQVADFEGSARVGAVAFVVNNKAYVATGTNDSGDPVKEVWEYDPITDDWTAKTDLPGVARSFAQAFSIGSKGYLGGGGDADEINLQDFWEYNPASNTWTQKTNLGGGARVSGVGFTLDGRGYVGTGGNNELGGDFWAYDPASNSWSEVNSIADGRIGAVAATADGVAYVGTGTAVSELNDFYSYIPKQSQSITFGTLTGQTFGSGTFTLGATASSSLTVSYTSSNTNVATIAGNVVTIVGVGTTTITAKQAGDPWYFAAQDKTQDLVVSKANQTITFNALTGKTFGDATFNLDATSTSGLEISYESSDAQVATISGNTVTIVGGGTTDITASQAGNANYNAATSVQRQLVVAKKSQAITFNALSGKTFGDAPFQLNATTTSSLTISYSSSNTAVATVSGNMLTIVGAGNATIYADQAGNNNYTAASQQQQSLAVAKANQTITLNNIPTQKITDGTYSLPENASSNLPVTYTSSDPAVATVSGHTVTFVAQGQTIITANQAGNANYNPAAQVVRVLTVAGDYISGDGQGQLWGVAGGGVQSIGMVYRLDANGGGFTKVSDFKDTDGKGYNPLGSMLEVDGKLYGLTSNGGKNNDGVLYAFDPATDGYEVIFDFSDELGQKPVQGLVRTPDGKIYGASGDYNKGTSDIFSFDPATKTVTKLASHGNNIGGFYIFGGITAGNNGKIYGTFYNSVAANTNGALFEFDPATNTITTKATFTSDIGGYPQYPLTLAPNGKLYGATQYGGANNKGTIFSYDPSTSTLSKIVDLQPVPGSVYHVFTLAANGKLYAMSRMGSSDYEGGIFELDPETNAYTRKFSFDGGSKGYFSLDGWMVSAPDGKLYGPNSSNSIFQFDPVTSDFTFVYNNTTDAKINIPRRLTFTTEGKVFGVSIAGGSHSAGSIFELDLTDNTIERKYDFGFWEQGGNPWGKLALAPNGKLYGMALGGTHGEGIIYEIDPASGAYTKKIDLHGGNNYHTGMITAPNGKLYGIHRGYPNYTIYEYDAATNTHTIKYTFAAEASVADEILILNGKIYGVIFGILPSNYGSIYSFDIASGTFATVYSFSNTGPMNPVGGLRLGLNGKFYGMTRYGGANGSGAIYEFNPLTNEFAKRGEANATYLTMDKNGVFFGTTSTGGTSNKGFIFSFDPTSGAYNVQYNFSEAAGYAADRPLTLSSNGKLYGACRYGGQYNSGTLFEFDPATNQYATKINISPYENYPYGYSHEELYFYNAPITAQQITFGPLTQRVYGEEFDLVASATSDLPVTFTSNNENIAKVTGKKVKVTGVGTVTITAHQDGNEIFDVAAPVSQSFTAIRANQTITFEQIADQPFNGPDITFNATASSGLTVSYTVIKGSSLIASNKVSLTALGPYSIRAEQSGDAFYNPAESVEVSFCSIPPKPVITVSNENTGAVTLTSNITATGATVKIDWYKDDELFSENAAKFIQVTAPGVYSVKLSIETCSNTSDDVAIIVTGIDGERTSLMSLFPNPAKDKLNIAIPGNKGSTVSMMHVDGRELNSVNSSAALIEMDVSHYSPGVYFIQVKNHNNGIVRQKFVKQ